MSLFLVTASDIDMGSMVTWPWLFLMRYFRLFSSAAIP